MQLLTLAQVQFEPFKRQFKYRIYSVSLALSLTAGIAITALVLVVRAWNESAWVGVFIGGWIAFWFGLFSWMIWRMLKARLRSTSWLVRTQAGEMLVKFRSYLNYHFPDDGPVVVRIAYSEIEWAREHKLRRSTPGVTRADDWNQRYRYLEFRFRDPSQTGELQQKLVEERQREGPRQKTWYGSGSSRSRHYPVQIVDGNVRVEWGVYPYIKNLLTEMGPTVRTEDPSSSKIDYRDLKALPQPEQEAMILQLIDGGDQMGAIRAVRHLYGYDLTRAKQFIDDLGGKSGPARGRMRH